MAKSIVCILLCLGIVRGNIRQVLSPGGGGSALPYYGQEHCDVICDEESYGTSSVCATDGKLYKSQCEYKNALCKASKTGDVLHITSFGACVTLDSTCDVVLQTKCLSHTISLSGSGHGVEPICGSNNRTYGSVCEFRSAQCHNEQMPTIAKPLTLAHTGECKIDTSSLLMVNCSRYMIDNSGLAIEGGAHVYPHGIPCPKNYKPICTLDGRTLSNECMYCSIEIATHHLLLCLYIAAGSQAGGHKSDLRREPCDQICEDDMYEEKICGTDGVSYKSMCEFDRAKCVATESGMPLEIYSTGACITLNTSCDVINDHGIKCEGKDADPLCASNNVTYDSVCTFMVDRCRHSPHKPLRVLHTGACVYDLSSAVQLNCSQYIVDTSGLAFENGTVINFHFNCQNHHMEPMCLLNGRTYHGSCRYCELLYREGTVTSANLVTYIQHTGRCQHSSVVG